MAKLEVREKSTDPDLIKLVDEQEVKDPETVKPQQAKQDVSDLLDVKVQKYLLGEGANLEVLQDKKLKNQLVFREKLYGQSAKAAVKHEQVSVIMESFNLVVNNDSAAGQVIFHIHLHIIPHKVGDQLWPSESFKRQPVEQNQETFSLVNSIREHLSSTDE